MGGIYQKRIFYKMKAMNFYENYYLHEFKNIKNQEPLFWKQFVLGF